MGKDVENSESPSFDFNGANFIYGAMVTDTHGVPVGDHPTIFKLTTSYLTFDAGIRLRNFTKSEMVLCSESALNDYHPDLISLYPTSRCLPTLNFTIGGSFPELTSFIIVKVDMCDNVTQNNSCKTPQEIANFFAGKKLG